MNHAYRVLLVTAAIAFSCSVSPRTHAQSSRPQSAIPQPAPADLRAESAPDLLGTDIAHPRLSWLPPAAQAAYQIQVAASADELQAGRLLWDSGEVRSAEHNLVSYAGPATPSRTLRAWRVRIRSADGLLSPWSAPASWETGLLSATDWSAQWIGGRQDVRHVWSDATFEWEFTLLGKELDFLFRARPEGKTYGEAYVWNLSQDEAGRALLTLRSRHYDPAATPLVNERTLRSVPLPASVGARAGKRHRLAVEARGELLVTRFDGAEVDRFRDASHREGTAGVYAKAAADAIVHALRVTADDPARSVEERFQNQDTALSGGTIEYDGLHVGGNAANLDIVFPITRPAPLLRRAFAVKQPVASARLYIASGGFPRIEINGRQVNEAIADGFTAYDKRVLYRTLDVTSQVRQGDNAIGVELGRGWYDLVEPNEWYWHAAPWRAPPTLRLQLELTLADGSRQTIASDAQWRWRDGPTLHDSIYAGERYDARRLPRGWSQPGFDDDAGWNAAALVTGPAGKLVSADQQPIAVAATRRPVSLKEPKPGVWVFDFGGIFAGRVRLNVQGPAGQTVTLVQHEKLREDGTVNDYSSHIDTQIQTDRYTLAGSGPEQWAPQFGYRGFRYVEVRGYPGTPTLDSLVGEVMHSDVASAGHFESSNPLLDAIQAASRRTLLNNLHGFVTDTPTFEKNGWTGDAHASALAAALNFDIDRVWRKWLADFRDAQAPSGEIPEIVPSTPFYGYENTPGWNMIGGPTPSWDAATFVLPDDLYRLTGDMQLLERMYPAQKRLLDYTAKWFTADSFLYANTVNTFLGEYALPRPPMSAEQLAALIAQMRAPPPATPRPGPVEAVSAAYFFHMTDLLSANAARLGRKDDAAHYARQAQAIRAAYNARYWDAGRHRYRLPSSPDDFIVYLNVLPVAFGIVPDGQAAEVVRQVAADLAANGYALRTSGVFSTRYLMLLLTDHGYVNTAYRIATRTEEPGWGGWLAHGIDTLPENWGLDSRSYDHHYWASISSWFYQGLAGIRPGAPGYAGIVIRPAPPAGLDRASAWLDTVRGRVGSSWTRQGGRLQLEVSIPAGATAEVWCPGDDRAGIAAPAAATRLRAESGYTVYAVPAGEHRFQCAP